ncbi:hypothetical protein U1Q18_039969 [Sarracenia purpurea var. burkii]
MGDIRHLPQAVYSSVRSGIILFDLTRVVEELVFNSLDAGATKISVAVGAGTCYVKVVDNGCGITRDGLVLLGERYATSKFDKLAEADAVTGTFGFRGEALSSISDVSLLEVITKAHGRPNGYRKVVKGCKCLYLGIDDGRQDVGTTVIVRDLFYNQPVRRKHIQSSTKKVLQSVTKSVLRMSLVHMKILFKVVDIESDDELFCTVPSPSPLSLFMSAFGIEVSSSLQELSVSDGVLKLQGYMSSPRDTSSVKAFQCVYINSRYIWKGPIHKLLNQLAASFNSAGMQMSNIGSQNVKQSRSQTYASYILNLSCPRSWYDITFEPSKTSVEFKDWSPIMGFIEKAIIRFWSDKFSNEEDSMRREADNTSSLEEDFPVEYRISKRCRIQSQLDLTSFAPPLACLETETEENDYMSDQKENRFTRRNASEFNGQQTGLVFDDQINFSSQSCDGLLAPSKVAVKKESGSSLLAPDNNIFSVEDHFLREKLNGHTSSILDYSLEDEHLNVGNGYTGSALSCDCIEMGTGEDLKLPFLRRCSSWRSLPLDRESLLNSGGLGFQIDGLRTRRKRLESDDLADVGEVDDSDQRFNFLRRTQWQDEAASVWSSARPRTECDILTSLDFLSRDSVKSSEIGGGYLAREHDPPLDSDAHIRPFVSTHRSFDSEWSSVMLDPLFGSKSHGVEQFFDDDDTLESGMKYDSNARYDYLEDREIDRDFRFDDSMQNNSSQENLSFSSWTNMHSDLKSYASSQGDGDGFLVQRNLEEVLFPKYSDILNHDREWLCFDSRGKHDCNHCAEISHQNISSIYRAKDEYQKDQIIYHTEQNVCKRRPRNHSAPPFYRGKKQFSALNNRLTMANPKIHAIDDSPSLQETSELYFSQRSSGVCQPNDETNSVEDLLVYPGPDEKKALDMTPSIFMEKKSKDLPICSMGLSEDIQDPLDSSLKWQKNHSSTSDGDKLHNPHNEDIILDVSSGILHLTGDSLIPESINKNCLKDAKVLQQVDKKFIPIVGGGVLAIIDQHAADERVRLEELRQKVLSGEKKTVTYLDTGKKLVLPEIEYQLLHNYSEQIQNWGWLCNIHSPGSRSFKKNLNLLHRSQSGVTLLAVPCILGVNLTDVDLLEFLQQLADTDGTSTIPPSVHRVLNLKACRGAIMFGDTLLPSECSLIVEELKQTSLCFQCAHGRPTTVPLVNLEALHKQIVKLGSWSDGSNGLWHGLRLHEPSLERAAHRLNAARGQC